ncbi:hypothetical protein I6A60_16515 [Frankia sp. AgB1.9]|uniref:hypothetical protein n=1 Tax=unclassified Frankia TaxID=2632575 RepID=UPI0019312AD4|nr:MULTISPECIES: hypothetical protein [unclassified Frankia]MBL7549469.1 hypothetical protein [Frankia sp. AgB1.9]MBL7619915.1 hypothetical protein [Frankia sp. AgB1.8]
MITVFSFGLLVVGAVFTFAISGSPYTAVGIVLTAAGLTATVLSGLRDYHRDKWREKMVARSIEKGMTTSDFADDFIVERASSEDADVEPDDVQAEGPYQAGPDSRHAQTLRAFEQQRGDIVSEAVFHTPRPSRLREIPRDE